ncbi:MAG: hypothetical protein Q4B26_20980 [Eubacteriales bacterium]|nr:hypothetical protein [Eubacteriales bacterium]
MYNSMSDKEQAEYLKEWRDRRLKKKAEKLRRKLEKVYRKYVGDETIRISLHIMYGEGNKEE